MRHLKGALDFKLCLEDKAIVLKGFCDADWGRFKQSMIHHMICVCLLVMEVFHGNARDNQMLHNLQQMFEYMVISYCTKGAIWIMQLLANVGFVQ